MLKPQTTMFLSMVLLCGCNEMPTLERPVKPATEEWFIALPRGLPTESSQDIRDEIDAKIANAPPKTWITFFLADNQELLGVFETPNGAKAFRRTKAKQALKKVYERLDPEHNGGSQLVDLISMPATVRKYRKTDLPPRLVVIGSPLVTDKEGGLSITGETIPCDGCVTDKKNSWGLMKLFPAGTTITWYTPRADYGNGPNHRSQVEHFLRYLLHKKNGPLIRLSSDASVVFNSTSSQWDDEVGPQDSCTSVKKVEKDKPKPTVYSNDGKTEVVVLKPDLSVKVQKPDAAKLKGPPNRVLFLPDTSLSVWRDPDGNDRSEIFAAIRADLIEKIDKMPFTHFAVCGFGGDRDYQPRLSRHPTALMGGGLYWCEATRKSRDRAIRFVNGLAPGGGTPTAAALAEAMKLEGPLTAVLYSDGVPTIGNGGQAAVLKLAEQLAAKGVTVNTVGVGALSITSEEFDWSGGEFLARIAEKTGGEYFFLE